MVRIRPFHPADAPQLLKLFRETIHRINSRDYSPQQVSVWSSDEIEEAGWTDRFVGRFVAVAEVSNRIAGFAELEVDGHIDRFYVSADHQRLGAGRALLDAILEEARRLGIHQLIADVSITARPFFERQGFAVLSPQVVVLRGVEFRNYRMARQLT